MRAETGDNKHSVFQAYNPDKFLVNWNKTQAKKIVCVTHLLQKESNKWTEPRKPGFFNYLISEMDVNVTGPIAPSYQIFMVM